MIDISHLKQLSTLKRFGMGDAILKEDTGEPYNMYILLKGRVGVYKYYDRPNEVLIKELGAGDFFGEMSLFLHEPRTATIVALEEAFVLEMNQVNAYEMIEKYPVIPYGIIKGLCQRLSDLNDNLGK